MIKSFYPKGYFKKIYDIPLEKLRQKNIEGLIFDIDNTLASYDTPEPDEETIDFINRASGLGFRICLLSNNTKKRVELFNKKLNIHAVHSALKPSRRGLRKAMKLLGTNEKSTLLIGDQVFTDVWCGNRAGVATFLVEPCSEKDEPITKIKRGIEKLILTQYKKSRQNNK